LYTCRDVHTVAKNVVGFEDDFTQVDTNAQLEIAGCFALLLYF